ncbi:MAG: 3'-5' exonuclease [Candidatus Lokiarchaeota archaeon]|nr:3'-5' exonuclease [Candidatus Lokiarchaeota archaeon]
MDVIVVDCETTGLKPQYDLILEIGIVELNLLTGETKVLFNSVVREPMFSEEHRYSWIFENSDLSFDEVMNAPLLDEVMPEIQAIFNKSSVTAYNKSFDLGFLKSRGIDVPNELPCIMKTATNILKIPFRGEYKRYKWPNCQESFEFFFPATDYIEKHRAADDAIHEAMILYEIFQRGYLSNLY